MPFGAWPRTATIRCRSEASASVGRAPLDPGCTSELSKVLTGCPPTPPVQVRVLWGGTGRVSGSLPRASVYFPQARHSLVGLEQRDELIPGAARKRKASWQGRRRDRQAENESFGGRAFKLPVPQLQFRAAVPATLLLFGGGGPWPFLPPLPNIPHPKSLLQPPASPSRTIWGCTP